MKRFTKFLAAAGALTLTAGALTACGGSDSADSTSASSDGPSRIVLTSYAAADTLQELDLVDKVAGITKGGSTFPVVLEPYKLDDDIKDVGTLKEPDMATIAEIGPDLIVYGARTAAMEEEFAKVSDDVIAGDADTADLVASNRAKVEELAALYGPEIQDKAQAGLDEIDVKVEETREKAVDAGTALVVMVSGGKVTVYGAGSRFDIIFNELGLKPAGEIPNEDSHGTPMSWEQIAELNPDHVFVVDRDASIGAEGEAARSLLDNEIFNRTNAVKNDDVHYLDSENWYLIGSGLGVLGAMIDEVKDAIS